MTIGVDINATTIKVGLVESGVIYRKTEAVFPQDSSEEKTIDCLIKNVRTQMNTNIKGIGVGVPSIVDVKRGIVYNTLHIPSWREVYLKDILEREFYVPVRINNDCNCFAFAERYYGEATPYRNVVALKLDVGVGAGIVINDVLYDGCNAGAGEVGSIAYRDSDFDAYCSESFFKKRGIQDIAALIDLGIYKTGYQDLWNEFGMHVGNLIKVILLTYDPQVIVIGGKLSKGYSFFSKKMNETLQSFPYPMILKRVKFKVSKNEDIELLGAAALIS